jgi:hypothetical protein
VIAHKGKCFFVLLVMCAAGGCGEGDRLSRQEFVREATEICSPLERELEALPQPQSLSDLGTYARRAGELTEDGLARLRELRPPEALERPFERYLTRVEHVVDLLDGLEAAAARDELDEAQRLTEEIAEVDDAQNLARAAGIPACERSS